MKNINDTKKNAAGSVKGSIDTKIETQGKGKDKQEKGKNKTVTRVPAMFLTANSESKKETKVAKDGDDGEDQADQSDAEEGEFVVSNPTSLIDIKSKSKSSGNSNKGGRPMNSLLDVLLQKCYQESAPEKHLFRCVGGCGMTYVNRNLNRTVRHATGCHRLPSDIRTRAKEHAVTKAPSRKLAASNPEVHDVAGGETMKDSSQKDVGEVVVVKKRKLNDASGVASSSKTTELYDQAKKLGRKERHKKIDLEVVILVCCTGIPTFITEQKVWKDVFSLANPTYVPATRAKLEEVQIVGEAENIQQIQIAYLKTQNNITVSCDGGTTRGRNSFWTLHMSTEDKKVFLMDVREATAESHTAVWIKSYVLEACHCLSYSKYRH